MGRDRVEICGLFVDPITFSDILDHIERAIAGRRAGLPVQPLALFSANVDMLVKASRDPVFAEELNSADILMADGMPLVWLSGLLGTPLPGRLAGSDLVPLLAERAAARGFSLFLLGSAPGVAANAAELLAARYPGLRIAGTLSPPLAFEKSARELARIRETLAAAAPDVVLVGLGAPKQERWILAERASARVAAFVAVGGTFDLLTERRRRAPPLLQRIGMEWMWRMAQEPGRLGRRYLIEDAPIFALGARAIWRRLREGRQ